MNLKEIKDHSDETLIHNVITLEKWAIRTRYLYFASFLILGATALYWAAIFTLDVVPAFVTNFLVKP